MGIVGSLYRLCIHKILDSVFVALGFSDFLGNLAQCSLTYAQSSSLRPLLVLLAVMCSEVEEP